MFHNHGSQSRPKFCIQFPFGIKASNPPDASNYGLCGWLPTWDSEAAKQHKQRARLQNPGGLDHGHAEHRAWMKIPSTIRSSRRSPTKTVNLSRIATVISGTRDFDFQVKCGFLCTQYDKPQAWPSPIHSALTHPWGNGMSEWLGSDLLSLRHELSKNKPPSGKRRCCPSPRRRL